MLRVHDTCRDNHVLGIFWSMSLRKTLVWVLVWIVSFASHLFPHSLAEMGSDVAFRSNNLRLTFAIAKLFI